MPEELMKKKKACEKLAEDLAEQNDPLKGAAMVGYRGGNVTTALDELLYNGEKTYAAVQNALDAAQGGTIRFSPGTYDFSGGTPIIRSNTRVIAAGEVIIVQPNSGQHAGFAMDPGSTDIVIDGFDIRGPWYGTGVPDWPNGDADYNYWLAHYAENIGIDVRGRWHQREVLGLSLAEMQTLTDESEHIVIRNCKIEGFGQSGIFADNVTFFRAENNRISKCGRDGIRMYGIVNGRCLHNAIDTISPGYAGIKPNYNVYGITATRMYGSAEYPDPETKIGRPSQNIWIEGNFVDRVATWKCLDTHGGVNITFHNNIARNAHIVIGIDHGGSTDISGKAPPRNIVVSNNKLIMDPDFSYPRAGITAFAPNTTEEGVGRNLTITGNTFIGCGGHISDGALSVSNFENTTVSGNVFRDSLRAAITMRNTVNDIAISGNVIDNVRITDYNIAYGILMETVNARGIVTGNSIRNRDQPYMTAGVSVAAPASQYGIKVGKDNGFHGQMNARVYGAHHEAGGSYFLASRAFANVDVTGAGAVLTAGKGITSVVRIAEGEIEVTLAEPFSSTATLVPLVTSKDLSVSNCAAVPISVSVIRVKLSLADGNAADAGFYITVWGY